MASTQAEIAEELAQAFVAEREANCPGMPITPDMRKPVKFLEAVPCVIRTKLTPAQWVKAVFRRFPLEKRAIIRPSHVASASLAAMFVEKCTTSDPKADLEQKVRLELELFCARLQFENPAFILTDQANSFSPLTRFVLANIHQLKDVSARYKTEAHAYRLEHPEVPQELTRQVTAMWARIGGS